MLPEESPPPTGHDPRPSDTVVLDASGLRALTHPVRVRLIGLLRTDGPSTATRLADRLDLNSGATSYHLRQLAAAGFVEEDPDRPGGRERWWRAVHRFTRFDDPEPVEREPAAALAYLQSVAAAHASQAQQAFAHLPTSPAPWRHALGLGDVRLRLTPEEASRLGAEIREVLSRYPLDDPDAERPPGTEPVSVVVHVLPLPEEPAPPTDTPTDPTASGEGNP
ncbi:helix-turn-helix domain-containing protein [Streptomyces alkaliphilus]|uniref:Helix-turn-helix domain-containing protein n=1 Tax=Streptomyces alkaliphilus TaxID=1472722 RepID=A0A7W3TFI0_9ACTN|nr:helix-turn-helix domain-containing protein [Streptomyces alkaliphilus]MBB0245807.1 helix-turn-helix domain-containing protein [Streptomyces alkaliphilus]